MKRFGRNQKRKLREKIKNLEIVIEGRAVYKSGNYWSQGFFVDQLKYKHWSKEEKERADNREKHLVRPSAEGNAICYCKDPSDATLIARALNFYESRNA